MILPVFTRSEGDGSKRTDRLFPLMPHYIIKGWGGVGGRGREAGGGGN